MVQLLLELTDTTGIPAEECVQLLLAQPGLLAQPPAQLLDRLMGLGQLLGLQAEQQQQEAAGVALAEQQGLLSAASLAGEGLGSGAAGDVSAWVQELEAGVGQVYPKRARQQPKRARRQQQQQQQQKELAQQGAAAAAAAAAAPAAPGDGGVPRELLGLLLSAPGLLLQQPEGLQANLVRLQQLLGISPEELQQVVRDAPGLMALSGEAAQARLQQLGATLGLRQQQALAVVQQQPLLLALAEEELLERAAGLAELLGVPPGLLSECIAREPRLLCCSREELVVRFDALAVGFGAFREDAVDVILADPSVLLRVGGEDS
jgi:hypothetical protein